MEQTVNTLESMFQKAESDLNYLSRKIDFEFEQENKANPAKLMTRITDIKKEYGELIKEAAAIQEAQKEAVGYFQTQLMTAQQLLLALQTQTGKQDGERPAELDKLEEILGIKLPGGDNSEDAACGIDTASAAVKTQVESDDQDLTYTLSKPVTVNTNCTAAPPSISPVSRRAESKEFLEVTPEEFNSVSELVRGRVKLTDVNSVYRILWQHFKEDGNSEALNPSKMYKMGLKVAGATGEAKLKVLRALKLCTISAKMEVKLV